MTDEFVQKWFLGDAEKPPGTGSAVWPPTLLKAEAYLCSAANHRGVSSSLWGLFFFYRMTKACGEKCVPFICTCSIHPQPPPTVSCSTETPMAPFLTLQRYPAQAAPDAPRRSPWHRRIVAVHPSSPKLGGWTVSTHPASDYSWIPSLFCRVWPLSPFFGSTPVWICTWMKK